MGQPVSLKYGTKEQRRTKTRIPSASAFHLSVIFLSSSSAISKYFEKIGLEPSTKSDSPHDVSFGADWCGCWWSPIEGAGEHL